MTPFESIKDLGVEDGVNGYVVPFDMDFDVNKLRKVPKFSYEYDNDKINHCFICHITREIIEKRKENFQFHRRKTSVFKRDC